MQSENLAFEWNDVALLKDQRACTFLGKTMFRIPAGELVSLREIEFLGWNMENSDENPKKLVGNVRFALNGVDSGGSAVKFFAEVPLCDVLRKPAQKTGEAKLIYSRGYLCEDYLLLEFILQIRQELQLHPSQVIAGQFAMEELLEIPADWPDCNEILTSVSAIDVQQCGIEAQILMIAGYYELTIVYADETCQGECLFAFRQKRPFQWQVPVPAGLHEITGVQPCYQSLSVELLNSRQIQLTGNGVLCTLPADVDSYPIYDEREGEPSQQIKEPMHTKSVVNSRGSRRKSLNRYMRNLNGMGQSPTSVRNFEIGDGSHGTDNEL